MTRLTLVVDAANVVGSRPDGWWRDRVGAAGRLRAALERLAAAGLSPSDHAEHGGETLRVVLVLEGAARPAGDDPDRDPGLTIVRAGGSGDDEIVAQATTAEPPVLVVTADRGLRARVVAGGAAVVGPRWLRERLADETSPERGPGGKRE